MNIILIIAFTLIGILAGFYIRMKQEGKTFKTVTKEDIWNWLKD